MSTWLLVIYMGITWAGVGAVRSIEYPSEDSCYRALDRMMVAQTNIVAGENSKQMIALCKPSDNTEDK